MSGNQIDRPTLLVFHKLTPRFTFGVTNYSPERLRQLIDALLADGFSIGLTDGRTHASPNSGGRRLEFSFDDGYEHLVDVLPPLMDRYGLRPIVFVPTDLAGCSNRWDYSYAFAKFGHLSREQIRELAGRGVVFGSHGAAHRDLTSCSDGELERELACSRARLQDWTGQSVDSISYPFGRSDRRVHEAADQAGYRFGYTMRFPDPRDQVLATGRIPVYGFDSPLSVRAKLSDGLKRRIEEAKSAVVGRLSGGTVWLNRIRGARAS